MDVRTIQEKFSYYVIFLTIILKGKMCQNVCRKFNIRINIFKMNKINFFVI